MIRPWMLAELNYGMVKGAAPIEVAILPLGATEPHNLHLPYGTDTLQVESLADQACKIAHEAGAKVLMLPPLPYGTETNQMNFPFAMNLQPTTVALVIKDLVDSLAQHGVRKFLLFNGHGGNDLKWLLRELHLKTPVHLFLCNWFKMVSDVYPKVFVTAGDHAGELETSLIQSIRPELVAFEQADSGTMALTRFNAVNQGWIEITRPWHLLTTNSGAGDPRAATAEKGQEIAKVVVERLSQFLIELAASEVNAEFPY